ncbi:MAG: hypothetical protein ACE5FT_03800 [Candidatus Nanoarchaeia archaeon]
MSKNLKNDLFTVLTDPVKSHKFLKNGLAIDSEPLAILLVGAHSAKDLHKISANKTTFDIVVTFMSTLNSKIIITLHVLTETLNLIKNKIGPHCVKTIVNEASILAEHTQKDLLNTRLVMEPSIFCGVGETSCLLACKDTNGVFLVFDHKAAGYSTKSGVPTIELEDLKSWYYTSMSYSQA